MNYCTKCQSLYSEPGTCNCYAGSSQGFNRWPRSPCARCGQFHPKTTYTGCPNSTVAPPYLGEPNTCSTVVPELAHPPIGGGLHFT